MNIDNFVRLFKEKIEELLDSDIIASSKDGDVYEKGDWTFLFNCTVFDIVKEYNQKNGTHLSLCAEPEAEKGPNGRGGYSDLLICSKDKKEKYIAIEHENSPTITNKLSELIKKLSRSKANFKLLITYWDDDRSSNISKKEIIDKLNLHIGEFFPKGEQLYLLIASDYMSKGEEYQLEVIPS